MPDETLGALVARVARARRLEWEVPLWNAINARFPADARPTSPGRYEFVNAITGLILRAAEVAAHDALKAIDAARTKGGPDA